MLAGSFEMAPEWCKLQEASGGSGLGKGKQEACHTPGCFSECGHHTQPVQGPPNHVCSLLPRASEGDNKDGVLEQGGWS